MPKINEILSGAAAIAKGMTITLKEMMNPVITEDYPDAPPVFQERYRGLHILQRTDGKTGRQWRGGADPRREGIVLGD